MRRYYFSVRIRADKKSELSKRTGANCLVRCARRRFCRIGKNDYLSGTVLVLSTPMMIALMEKTCRLSVKPYLEEGQETVGTHERFVIDEKKFADKMETKKQ